MPLAVFLDFEAAFPSISQHFIQAVLASRGWPPWFRHFIGVLYDNNYCVLALGGAMGEGFSISQGSGKAVRSLRSFLLWSRTS